MLVSQSEQFVKTPFVNEAEIERVVQDFSEQLFGPSIVYLPQTRIATLGGIATVPDAIVIDVKDGEWYVVEAERAVHGTWQHIAPQISRQLAAIGSQQTRERIVQLALTQIRQSEELREMFIEIGIAQIEIHGRLQMILAKAPAIAIPIESLSF